MRVRQLRIEVDPATLKVTVKDENGVPLLEAERIVEGVILDMPTERGVEWLIQPTGRNVARRKTFTGSVGYRRDYPYQYVLEVLPRGILWTNSLHNACDLTPAEIQKVRSENWGQGETPTILDRVKAEDDEKIANGVNCRSGSTLTQSTSR